MAMSHASGSCSPFLWNNRLMAPTPGLISKRPDRCGGDACVRDLRTPVWAVVNHQRLGATDAEILFALINSRLASTPPSYT
jgi:Protein of unknown function (DUF433)